MKPTLHRYEHKAMSTIFELMVVEEDYSLAQSAAHAVFQKIDRLEELFSRFIDISEVSMIHQLKPGEPFRVSPEMMELLLISVQVCAATQGAFDVTVGPLMDALGDVKGRWSALTCAEREAASAACGMNRLTIDTDNLLIAIQPDQQGRVLPVGLDFGAIAKGYALDLACRMLLEDWDFTDFLLHGGTSTVVARGSMGDGPTGWPVGVGGDWQTRIGLDTVRLQNAAISGSGFDVKGAHVIDIRKGVAATRHAAAWSCAPTAAYADALSTAFLGLDWKEIKNACDRLGGCGALVARNQPLWMDKLRRPVRHYCFIDFQERLSRLAKRGSGPLTT